MHTAHRTAVISRLLFLPLAFAFAAPAYSQDVFEVASIRPSGPQSVRGSDGGPGTSAPGRYSYGRATLLDLIAVAYDVDFFQVTAPSPLDRDQFDLAATLPPGATKPQLRKMMQNLLRERFQLRAHIESKEFSALALVVSKSGHKLTESRAGSPPAAQDSRFPQLTPGQPAMVSKNSVARPAAELVRISAQQQSVAALARFLRTPQEKPIVDATGLEGTYDFTFEYSRPLPGIRPPDSAPPPVLPDIFTALQQQLGLQLVDRKAPFDVVVVDSFNRAPTEN